MEDKLLIPVPEGGGPEAGSGGTVESRGSSVGSSFQSGCRSGGGGQGTGFGEMKVGRNGLLSASDAVIGSPNISIIL